MTACVILAATSLLLAHYLSAQVARIPTTEDMCRENPKAPLCLKIDSTDLTKAIRQNVDTMNWSARTPRKQRQPASSAIVQNVDPPQVITAAGAPTRSRTTSALQLSPAKKWRFAHPDAAVLAGLRIKDFRESAAGRKAIELWMGALPGPGADMVRPAIEDLDEILVSMDTRNNAQPLVLITGRFKDEQVRRMLHLNAHVPGANALLIGDAAAVAAAKRRIRTGAAVDSALLKQAKELNGGNDLWVAGLPASFGNLPAGQQASVMEMFEGVRAFSLGMSLRDMLTVDLNVNTASAASADSLFALYETARRKAIESMEGSTAQEKAAWDQIEKDLSVEKRPDGLRFRLAIDPNQIPTDAARQLGVNLPIPGTRPARPVRQSVMIHGMEGGPKEIPFER